MRCRRAWDGASKAVPESVAHEEFSERDSGRPQGAIKAQVPASNGQSEGARCNTSRTSLWKRVSRAWKSPTVPCAPPIDFVRWVDFFAELAIVHP